MLIGFIIYSQLQYSIVNNLATYDGMLILKNSKNLKS